MTRLRKSLDQERLKTSLDAKAPTWQGSSRRRRFSGRRSEQNINHDVRSVGSCSRKGGRKPVRAAAAMFARLFTVRRPFLCALAACLLAAFASVCVVSAEPKSRFQPPSTVATQVALVSDPGGLALVVDMSAEATASASYMASPLRLVLDFANVRFQASAVPHPPAGGPVAAVRFGAFMRGEGRAIVELAEPMRAAEQRFFPLEGGGKRLVIRLEPIPRAAFMALAKPIADDIVTGSTARAQGARPQELPLVFLDPGHGGIDSGATGPGGELEKTLVLQFAMALKERLERGGKARVAMSRTSDVFVPLRDRVRLARQAKAQLFISLHADALPADEGEARGATIYTLSERATDERTARLAEKENRADLAAGIESREDQDEVADILFDLARRESRAFSGQFARQLVQTLPKATRLHRNPLKGAGFRVLRAPDVPSVLVELGYLTSPDEARLMMTEEWRRGAADAMADAIERFLQERIGRETDKP
jgi:N-acetylmuramoyl-L-alanine amidase